MLQGNLLVSEANFLKLFPDTGGYRFFLIEARRSAEPRRMSRSAAATADDATLLLCWNRRSPRRASTPSTPASSLPSFLAVQNTYLSTFQSLGALGLLLGTVGLAVVQLRSVLERRGELALMRAGGFRPGRLVRMVVGRMACCWWADWWSGCVAAAVALIPQWAPQGASVPWLTLGAAVGHDRGRRACGRLAGDAVGAASADCGGAAGRLAGSGACVATVGARAGR